MNYKKLAFQTALWSSIAILTGCTATYQAPQGDPNVANFTYSNSNSVYIKGNPVDCSTNQKLPTNSGSLFSVFEGGVDPNNTTQIPAGRLVTIGFTGSDLEMPALSTDNQIASKVLSLITKGKHDSSVTDDQFKQSAEDNCSFMVSFIPQKNANYRYAFSAANFGHDIGGASFRCSLQIQVNKAGKWQTVPVVQRTANQGQLIVNGVPSKCSTAGIADQLNAGNLSNLPMVTTVSQEFTLQSGTSNGMITSDS